MKKYRLGILGCGRIAPVYLKNFNTHMSFLVDLEACADIDEAAARERAEEFGVRRVLTPEELVTDPEVDIVVNLAIPEAHYDPNRRALEAGKHVYTEKPMCLTSAEAVELAQLAQAKGVRLAMAPDTILGAGMQTARSILDNGTLGPACGAVARLSMRARSAGYLRPAVGPVMDMGPYYVAAFVNFFGPVASVSALASGEGREFESRYPGHRHFREKFVSQVPCTLAAHLRFRSGQVATLFMTVESNAYDAQMEVYCEGGTIEAGDPNNFPSTVKIRDFENVSHPVYVPYVWGRENHRGVGVMEMIHAIEQDRPHRLKPEFGIHVTEVLEAMLESARSEEPVKIQSTCERPEAVKTRGQEDVFRFR